jgi:hypothetical protein
MRHSFEEIRPYSDAETPQVMQRLLADPRVDTIIQTLFPDTDMKAFRRKARAIASINAFQHYLSWPLTDALLRISASSLTYEGLEHIDPESPCLFISNHRDIVLDSALLDYIMMEHSYSSAFHAIGNNLLHPELVSDLFRLNKNFIVHRDVPRRKIFSYSHRVSAYIRYVLEQLRNPVWISQSEGRAKDGDDRTQTSLLKMIAFCAQDDYARYFSSLRIVPVAVSYEFDPCDALKARELYARRITGTYRKKEGEDTVSILTGLTKPKGRVHLALGAPLDTRPLSGITQRNAFFNKAAALMDRRIHALYRLWPVNYAAADVLQGDTTYAGHYDTADKEFLVQRVQTYCEKEPCEDKDAFARILYTMYANPVRNAPAHA